MNLIAITTIIASSSLEFKHHHDRHQYIPTTVNMVDTIVYDSYQEHPSSKLLFTIDITIVSS